MNLNLYILVLLAVRGATYNASIDGLEHGEHADLLNLPPSDALDLFIRLDADSNHLLNVSEIDDGEFKHFVGKELGGTAEAQLHKLDADKDGYISEDEYLGVAEPRMEHHFAHADFSGADADKNGMLDLKEYKMCGHAAELTERHKHEQTLVQINALHLQHFSTLDRDGDNKISNKEYLKVQGQDPFSKKDQDGDGRLNKTEYVYHETHFGGLETADAESMFADLDSSKDGFLSRIESRGAAGHGLEDFDEGDFEEQAANFEAIDADSNGSIDYGEWVDFRHIHSEDMIPESQIKAEFGMHDFDKDGKVSHEEFLQNIR